MDERTEATFYIGCLIVELSSILALVTLTNFGDPLVGLCLNL